MQPPPPKPDEERPGSWFVVWVVLTFGVGMLALLAMFAPHFFFLAAGLLLLMLFHYVAWGWWLGHAVKREAAEKEELKRMQEETEREERPMVREK